MHHQIGKKHSELSSVAPSASSKINLARVEAGARGCHVSQAPLATCAYRFVLPSSLLPCFHVIDAGIL